MAAVFLAAVFLDGSFRGAVLTRVLAFALFLSVLLVRGALWPLDRAFGIDTLPVQQAPIPTQSRVCLLTSLRLAAERYGDSIAQPSQYILLIFAICVRWTNGIRAVCRYC